MLSPLRNDMTLKGLIVLRNSFKENCANIATIQELKPIEVEQMMMDKVTFDKKDTPKQMYTELFNLSARYLRYVQGE